ncbi:MAG TPA: hypothetical protein VEZ14_14320 [Dehalococcoidia bacterium]|nr:hypothetical protein [Dehalococcoidia bacterium]
MTMEIKTLAELTRLERWTTAFGPHGLMTDRVLKDEFAAEFVQKMIADTDLRPQIPSEVRDYFETARKLHIYGLFVYEFHALAADRALFACGFALRERYRQWMAQTHPHEPAGRAPTLRALLTWAKSEGLLSSARSDRSLAATADLRNFAAHPDMNAVATPPDSARVIADSAALINELWSPA